MRSLLFTLVFVAVSVNAQDCSKAPPVVQSPSDDIKKAQLEAKRRCETEVQRRELIRYRGAQILCEESADVLQQRQNLTPAQRLAKYDLCLKGHGF